MYLTSNLVSNLHPLPVSKWTRFNQHKGPTAHGGAQSPSSSPDAAPTSGVGPGSPFICLQGGISSTTQAGIRSHTPAPCPHSRRARRTSFSPGREHKPALGLLQEEKPRTEHLPPLFEPPPEWQGPATSIIFTSCFSTSPCQHAPSPLQDTFSFIIISQHLTLTSSVFYANSSKTKHSPEDESWHPEELQAAWAGHRESEGNTEGPQAAQSQTPEQQQMGST